MSYHRPEPERVACSSCGSSFWRTPSESWKRLCLDCWKAGRKTDQPDRLAEVTAERDALRRELARLRLAPPAAGIPPDMLARLIRLCHPDRHQGSEAANVATAWLLAQRREARA